MKFIEKIEIKNFRNFLGTKKKQEVFLEDVNHLNIISGANDSGKSNILRALNLFFNDNIAFGKKYTTVEDFPKQKENDTQKVTEIRIFFNFSWDVKRDKFLPKKFSISKFYDRGGFRNYKYFFIPEEGGNEIAVSSIAGENDHLDEKYHKSERRFRAKFNGFLKNNLSFTYIPAIREERFFSYLYGRVINQLKKNEDRNLDDIKKKINDINNFRTTIKRNKILIKKREKKIKEELKKESSKQKKPKLSQWKKSKKEFENEIVCLNDNIWRKSEIENLEKKISKESFIFSSIKQLEIEINKYSKKLFERANFLESEFQVGDGLKHFFETFTIGTGENKNLSLKLRGDGIQAKFIPEIINFLNELESEDKRKYFIWGFEEPENSFEYKNQQYLANRIKNDFSHNKQIFLTTHSEEFLSLYDDYSIPRDSRKSNLYFVQKYNYLDEDNCLKNIIKESKEKEFSKIKYFDVEKRWFLLKNVEDDLYDEIGSSIYRAKYSKDLKELSDKFLEKKSELEKSVKKLKSLDTNIIMVEGIEDREIIQKAIEMFSEKINEQLKNGKLLIKHSSSGASGVRDALISSAYNEINKKCFGIFDADKSGNTFFEEILGYERCKKQKRKKIDYIKFQVSKDIIEIIKIFKVFHFELEDLYSKEIWEFMDNEKFLEPRKNFSPNMLYLEEKSVDELIRDKFPGNKYIKLLIKNQVIDSKKKTIMNKIIKHKEASVFLQNFKLTVKKIEEFFEN